MEEIIITIIITIMSVFITFGLVGGVVYLVNLVISSFRK